MVFENVIELGPEEDDCQRQRHEHLAKTTSVCGGVGVGLRNEVDSDQNQASDGKNEEAQHQEHALVELQRQLAPFDREAPKRLQSGR